MTPLRIFIVDDSVVVRRLLHHVIESEPDIESVGSAPNGRIALNKLSTVDVDVVILDVEMPIMNGLETLSELRKRHADLPVLMFSALTKAGAETSVEALMRGATDCFAKPTDTRNREDAYRHIRATLIPAIRDLRGRKRAAAPRPNPRISTRGHRRPRLAASLRPLVGGPSRVRPAAIAIGSSTGGPNALARVIVDLGRRFSLPIAITQHMPPLFTEMLAQRLDDTTDLSVREAKEGDVLRPGTVLIAPGDYHLVFVRTAEQVLATLTQDPPENSCRPSVDVMFRSLARCYGPSLVAVVLTGMGTDGCLGVRAIREAGGSCVVQDRATSTVWGMPGAVVRAGLADEQLPLEAIGGALRGMTLARPMPRRPSLRSVVAGRRRT